MAAEYAAPALVRSTHAKQMNVAANEMTGNVTEFLRPTTTSKLYPLIGVAPPEMQRNAATRDVKSQDSDPRYPLFGHTKVSPRLT